ncbi:UDP-glucuronic acid decarboxylase family protein [Sutcliffiella horikoshii]|uniref:UDP-glucuronic acid decarboxylase family protein n=1 Tax=Sutcliffiella horikoshii TaxID=79883 RepID=UPI001F34880F|nr:UDP-glucuronic acid decarboxylase family protein [Sutcliffiella horikoshii]MCG1020147.1 SDR family oxidoreductase [Sutcliffiella horikoshii]
MKGRILITGVAGFLGSHLAEELLLRDYKVVGIDNFSTGKEKNLKKLKQSKNFTFIEADVSSNYFMALQNQLEDIDEIYHLASPASPAYYLKKPIDTIDANTLGTKNVLDLAQKNNAKVVYASTSEAYGDPLIHPQSEKYRGNVNTWGPRACYDESKRLGEVYCYLYYSLFNTKVKVARIFNTYSAGLANDDGRVISNFVNQALLNEDITVYGDGTQTRSFCYVTDTIRGLILMMEKESANGQIINIGNPKEYTILEMANLVKKLSNSKSRITFHPLPIDDPKQRKPDISKARKLLGWTPQVDVVDGLNKTITNYKNQIDSKE